MTRAALRIVAAPGAGAAVAATVATGVAAGVLGSALTLLLHAIQHLLYGYSENAFLLGVEHASHPRRVLALGGTGVVVGLAWWASRRVFTQESVSVTHALRVPRPRLPVAATLADALVQIVAVAGGASLGREGAPRQSGATAGGLIAARLGVSAGLQRVLLASGAGAGLAAVYNVPIGGAVFTLEALLGTCAVAAIVPALVTSAIATGVAWALLGSGPTYRIPAVGWSSWMSLWAIALGVLAGVVGLGFTRLMTVAREHAPTGWRTAIAVPVVFAGLGTLAIAYPQLPGNGKGPAGLAFDGTLGLGLAATLFALKPLVTAACLGAGAIGGVLTPALATGALLGAVAGRVTDLVWPGEPRVQFAVAGAAALLAVTQRAPITAAVLTLEFVGGGDVVLVPPIVIAVLVATVVAAAFGQRGVLADRVVGWFVGRVRR